MAGARPKSFTPSIYKGSEEVIECPCTPCARLGTDKEAVNYCTNCSEYFCPACTKDHTKFGMSATHNVVDRAKAKQASGGTKQPLPVQLPTERCKKHQGELITSLCRDHDLVVCNSCAMIDHRLCKRVDYIPTIPGDPKTRQAVPRVKDELLTSLKAVKAAKVNVQKRTPMNDDEKAKHLATIKDHTQHIIAHARDMEKSAIADVNRRHQETAANIATELAQLDDSEDILQQRFQSLDKSSSNNESQVLVDTNLGRREAEVARRLEQRLQSSGVANVVTSTFALDARVSVVLSDVNSFGQVVVNKPFKTIPKGSCDIKLKGAESVSSFSDSCELQNGDIILTDYHNDCIKVFNTSFKVVKRFKALPYPWGICQTRQHEVAVTLTEEKRVQFVDISGSWKMTSSFAVGECCRGIAYTNEELFVSCGGHPGSTTVAAEGPAFIAVFDIAGSLRRKIQLDDHGQRIFSFPYHIITSNHGNKIHITDKKGGVITIDRQGNILSTFSQNITKAVGLCFVDDQNLIVSGTESNNALQISTDGKLVTEIISKKDGLKEPLTLIYLRAKSVLAVTGIMSNEIRLFNLEV